MKATGIVRRIDDLGRVVIPKEIRRTMRIREGSPLEIYTDRDGEVIFRKYSMMDGISDLASHLCDAIHTVTGRCVMVTDRDTVLAVSGAPRRDYCDKGISPELEQVMRARSISCPGPQEQVPIAVGADSFTVSVAVPILAQSDVAGCVVLARSPGEGGAGTSERTLISAAAAFLGKSLDE